MPAPYLPPFTISPRQLNRISWIQTDQVTDQLKVLLRACGSDGELNLR